MIIIGIDPGIVNFAYYIGEFNFEKGILIHKEWGNVSLLSKSKSSSCKSTPFDKLCSNLIIGLEKKVFSKYTIGNDYIFLIEKQLQKKLQLIAHTIWCRHFPNCIYVNATDIKRFFDVPFGDSTHQTNKRRMVERMKHYISPMVLKDGGPIILNIGNGASKFFHGIGDAGKTVYKDVLKPIVTTPAHLVEGVTKSIVNVSDGVKTGIVNVTTGVRNAETSLGAVKRLENKKSLEEIPLKEIPLEENPLEKII
ncbi:hypothetical protein ACTFIY_006082 [Dictyostelium cf. discoideum]